MPEDVPDKILMESSIFRDLNRFPTVSYFKKDTNSVLLRSAQPLCGIKGLRSFEDEQYVRTLFSQNDRVGCIIEARTRRKAQTSQRKGGGTETEAFYGNVRLYYSKIEKPSKVKEIHQVFKQALRNPYCSANAYLEASGGYFQQLQALLRPAIFTANNLNEGISSLIHCDNGLQSTSAICSIVKLLVDPYYRTCQGFGVLLQEEWLSMGFDFSASLGFKIGSNEKQTSVTFLLFLDCCYQIMNQIPTSFGFDSLFLIYIFESILNCKYGNFLLACDKERIGMYETADFFSEIPISFEKQQTEKSCILPSANSYDLVCWHEMHSSTFGFSD